MKRFRTHYDNLQVQENASPEVIRGAWLSLARKWDPETHGEPERAARVRRIVDESYKVLSDAALRREHDAWIRAQREIAAQLDPGPPDWQGAVAVPDRARRPRRFGVTTITLLWVLLFAALWWLFDDYLDRREFPNRNLAVAEGAATEWVLRRNHVGQYLAPGRINGESVVFLLDTGATQVSVPAHLADTLGLHPGARGRAITANGSVDIRHTRIHELGLGPFVLRNVPGHLNPGMSTDQVLLGMSVLKHLDFAQRGEHLILSLP